VRRGCGASAKRSLRRDFAQFERRFYNGNLWRLSRQVSWTKEGKSVKGNKNPEIHDAAPSEKRWPGDGSMG